jgi:SAM-dependent methyltransferase
MKTKLLRALGFCLLIDGLLALLLGRGYVRLFHFGSRSGRYRQAIDLIASWPGWKVRSGGATEAVLGLAVLRQAPLDVQTVYQNVAGVYAAVDPGYRQLFYPQAHQAFDRALRQHLPEGGSVLDLGSGAGANLARLILMHLPFGAYTGVDLTEAMLAQARAHYGHWPGVQFRQLNLITDPLPEGPFDLILSTWVFEHLPDPARVAHKAWEQLAPGGHMVLLLEAEADSWWSRLLNWVYPVIGARLVQDDDIRQFPGVISVERYAGPLGDLALVIVEKPATSV